MSVWLGAVVMCVFVSMSVKAGQANRATKTASIVLNGDVSTVFSMFGFLEEKKWSRGWEPTVVSMGATLQDSVFTYTHEGVTATWIVSEWDEARFRVTYSVFVPNERAMTIRIVCSAEGKKTRAEVTYALVALGEQGSAALEEFEQQDFAKRLLHWQYAINHYLETGKQWDGDSH